MARTLSPERLLPLLRTLSDGAWHSGEALAADGGVTRAALSKRVQKLIEWGLPIETQPGRGSRLIQSLELLDADLIRGHLSANARAQLRFTVLASTDSTNTQLMAAAGANDPQALLAEHQTGGRGRHGRRWHSPFGANLYVSLAWTFAQWPAALTALPLAVGVATARALASLELPALKLKWPNDLWHGDAKLGGILIEQRGETGGSCRVVIGLGLNVAMRTATSAEITQPWTSLHEALGKAVSRNMLAARILDEWLAMLGRYALDGFTPFEPEFRALDLMRGRPVTVLLPEGEASGIARGVDEAGALLVDAGGERRRVLSGEVALRSRPGPLPQ
ncbi:MAG TPA: biotin--[acetyl-CoA-carboxylase] ligase [Verrucomicrobiae bacterium]|nr:biotin--[acetyl-CoA-carboxylase] ligase [Verrucomicrobiae bacterium]